MAGKRSEVQVHLSSMESDKIGLAFLVDTGCQDYYVGNIPKKATEGQLRSFLCDYGEIKKFEFRLENCTYCPTKVAFVTFSKALDEKTVSELNRKTFEEKRLFVANTASEKYFTPLTTIVVRYLNANVSEEDIYNYFEEVGAVECVQKPAHTYAYVSFKSNESVNQAFRTKYRPLKGVEAYVVAVKRKISMFLENRTPMRFASIVEKCDGLELFYDPASENETTLLITNIPRDTEEDDLLDYLGKFGKIIDWDMQKSATCVVTNIGYVTYQHPKMARTAYLSGPLCFQGIGLEVYNHKLRYTTNDSSRAIILRRTSVYLTDDEIFQKFSELGHVEYIQRLDTVNYNTVVRLSSVEAAKRAEEVTCIAGEDVHIRSYTMRQYSLAMAVAPGSSLRKPPKRQRKESLLQQIIDTEDRRNIFQLQTVFNEQYCNPNLYYYRNEVQVWNYPPKFGLEQFREFFKKYGNVINLRELKPHPSSATGVVYISFETKLEAKRVSKMNQTFMGSKRLLMLMADQKIVHDPALCVRVGNLTEEIMDEDLYDRFNMIGNVKYVFRPQMPEAIVCMVKERYVKQAVKVVCVGRFPVLITPLMSSNNMWNPPTERANTAGSMIMETPVVPPYGMGSIGSIPETVNMAMDPRPIGPHGRMASGMGMVPAPLPVPAPIYQPLILPGGTSMVPMGAAGLVPIQMGGPHITPRMRGLMQAVEQKMIKSKNFTTLPMLDQFNVVHDIVNHCLNFPHFLSLDSDEKIRYLIGGQNGFQYTNIFTLFTYPEQLQMLSVIESYYRSTFHQGSIGLEYASSPTETTISQPNTLVVLTQDQQPTPMEPAPDVTNKYVPTGNYGNDNAAVDDDENVPPAPSPPPMFVRSRSASPQSDDAKVQSRSMVLNGAAQRLRESALRRRDESSSPQLPDANTGQKLKSKSSKKRSRKEDGYAMTDRKIIVTNVPNELNEQNMRDFFSKHGKIIFVLEQKNPNPDINPTSKGFVIQYETVSQAIKALEVHLTILLGRLVRVEQYTKKYNSRHGYAISVTCPDQYSEVAIYETFKSCGEVRCIWTHMINGKEQCVIDYWEPETVQAALKITYLHSGGRCRAIAI